MVSLAWNLLALLALLCGVVLAASMCIGFLEGVLGIKLFPGADRHRTGPMDSPPRPREPWDDCFGLPGELLRPRTPERKVHIPDGWKVHPAPGKGRVARGSGRPGKSRKK